ncbi:hypothetical protein AB1Y20_022953 [Prymnesium parvum]|uniref:DWNN domain-containing protein n=1 Tax=Prymnesium parvum TaxID=97485 RepID=A0AB34JEZ8_PRYPA
MPEVKYKLKSEPTYTAFTFEGPSVTAARLRQEVIEQKLKGNAGAMGLLLTNTQTGQEYIDDDAAVPADALILVKRVPLSRLTAGFGGASTAPLSSTFSSSSTSNESAYTLSSSRSPIDANTHPETQRNVGGMCSSCNHETPSGMPVLDASVSVDPRLNEDPRLRAPGGLGMSGQGTNESAMEEQSHSSTMQDIATPQSFVMANDDEAAKIQNMMAQAGAEWTHRSCSGGRGGYYGKGKGGGRGVIPGGKGVSGTGPTPPAGYTCFRCNQTGHFIQFCPTNGDPKFDAANKRRMPVGIPRDRLEVIATADTEDGERISGFQMPDGSIARMVADESQFVKATKDSSSKVDDADVPEELRCPVTRKLFRNAVLLPCCGASVSDNAVSQALIDEGGAAGATCVLCGTQGVAVDELVPNRQMRDAVDAFLEDVKGANIKPGSEVANAMSRGQRADNRQTLSDGRSHGSGSVTNDEEALRLRTLATMRNSGKTMMATRTSMGGVGIPNGTIGANAMVNGGMGGYRIGNCGMGSCGAGGYGMSNCSMGNCSIGNCGVGNCGVGNRSMSSCGMGGCGMGQNCGMGNWPIPQLPMQQLPIPQLSMQQLCNCGMGGHSMAGYVDAGAGYGSSCCYGSFNNVDGSRGSCGPRFPSNAYGGCGMGGCNADCCGGAYSQSCNGCGCAGNSFGAGVCGANSSPMMGTGWVQYNQGRGRGGIHSSRSACGAGYLQQSQALTPQGGQQPRMAALPQQANLATTKAPGSVEKKLEDQENGSCDESGRKRILPTPAIKEEWSEKTSRPAAASARSSDVTVPLPQQPRLGIPVESRRPQPLAVKPIASAAPLTCDQVPDDDSDDDAWNGRAEVSDDESPPAAVRLDVSGRHDHSGRASPEGGDEQQQQHFMHQQDLRRQDEIQGEDHAPSSAVSQVKQDDYEEVSMMSTKPVLCTFTFSSST